MTTTKKYTLSFIIFWFVATIVTVYFELTGKSIIEIYKVISTLTGSALAIYSGKSGYEFYSRSRYSSYTSYNDGEINYDEWSKKR